MNSDIKNNIRRIMTKDGQPQLCIDVFLSQYKKMASGEESSIRETVIQAVHNVTDMDSLANFSQQGKAVLNQAVILKLNGGLGTGMGLEKAKSLLPAKQGLSFLEIIVKQVISQRRNFNCDLPLIFMNSFNTENDTQQVLKQFPELTQGQKDIPFSFIQNRVPKILLDSKEVAIWPTAPAKTWCPPGHGDIYTALQTSGLLDQLLNKGIKYAFISNSDNLGADLDLSLLGYFSEQDSSFMMEVADRTAADKKGGHLARSIKGNLLLRESAQCHNADINSFQDIKTYKYFNTNNLWIRLDRLKQLLDEKNGVIDLPLIQNIKTLDPRNTSSPKVIQMETAMGAAISNFTDAIALRIPKSRFIPIKTTNELLGLWSNAFVLDNDNLIAINPDRKNDYIIINLDNKYFKNIDDLQTRFAEGIPDLLECQQLTIIGDVKFGSDVKIIGNVTINNDSNEPLVIASNTLLKNQIV